MNAIGEILKRKGGDGPASIRVVGIRDGDYIVRDAEQHAPPFSIAPDQLAANYGGSANPIEQVDENAIWLSMDRNWLRRAQVAHDAAENGKPYPLTPEEQFRAAEDS